MSPEDALKIFFEGPQAVVDRICELDETVRRQANKIEALEKQNRQAFEKLFEQRQASVVRRYRKAQTLREEKRGQKNGKSSASPAIRGTSVLFSPPTK